MDICPPKPSNFLLALDTIIAAFHLIIRLIFFSSISSPGYLGSDSGGIVFTYGLFVRGGIAIFLSLASLIRVCKRYLALSSPFISITEAIESIHSSVS